MPHAQYSKLIKVIMTIKLRKPILIGGIGLSLLLWLLDSFQNALAEVGEVGAIAVLALGSGWWLLQKSSSQSPLEKTTTPVSRETVEKAIAAGTSIIAQIEAEGKATSSIAIGPLKERSQQLIAELDRQELRLAVTGGKATGKTKLVQLLQGSLDNFAEGLSPANIIETSPLFRDLSEKKEGAPDNNPDNNKELERVKASDLVLFVTAGDLTDPEFQTICQLVEAGVQSVVVWNKQDQYLEEQQPAVLQQVRSRLEGTLDSEDVVATSAAPAAVKVRQHQPDGSVQEKIEQPAAEIGQLVARLSKIAAEEREKLILASTGRQAEALKLEAKTALNEVRRDRAMPIVEQYQWVAAAAAFANPVSALDLLAAGAITAQLVIDVGNIYGQKFSLEQGKVIATTLAELTIKLGIVELSTSAIAAVLKSNAVTFVAGGVVQGVSAAYLTRLAGLSAIAYFQALEPNAEVTGPNLEKLGKTVQTIFEQNKRQEFWLSFVKQVTSHLVPESKKSASLTSQVEALQQN